MFSNTTKFWKVNLWTPENGSFSSFSSSTTSVAAGNTDGRVARVSAQSFPIIRIVSTRRVWIFEKYPRQGGQEKARKSFVTEPRISDDILQDPLLIWMEKRLYLLSLGSCLPGLLWPWIKILQGFDASLSTCAYQPRGEEGAGGKRGKEEREGEIQ